VIATWRSGTGPPALVLHGGPGLSDYTEPLAVELADVFRCIRYQQRGLDPTTLRGPYTVEAHVADACRVLDQYGFDRAWVVGHSWGGHLAMHLAVAEPERVAGLVLVDALGAVEDGGRSEMQAQFASRMPADELRRAEELDGEGSAEAAVEAMRLWWPYYFADPTSAPPMPPFRISPECSTETWASIEEHVRRRTLERGLPDVGVPALVVHGDRDPLPLSASERTAALLPDARLGILQDCGHFPWLEREGAISSLAGAVLRIAQERSGAAGRRWR
jgi:proline iminopeptidase